MEIPNNNILSLSPKLPQDKAEKILEEMKLTYHNIQDWIYQQSPKTQSEIKLFHLRKDGIRYSIMKQRIPAQADLYSVNRVRIMNMKSKSYEYEQKALQTLLNRVDPRITDLFSRFPHLLNKYVNYPEEIFVTKFRTALTAAIHTINISNTEVHRYVFDKSAPEMINFFDSDQLKPYFAKVVRSFILIPEQFRKQRPIPRTPSPAMNDRIPSRNSPSQRTTKIHSKPGPSRKRSASRDEHQDDIIQLNPSDDELFESDHQKQKKIKIQDKLTEELKKLKEEKTHLKNIIRIKEQETLKTNKIEERLELIQDKLDDLLGNQASLNQEIELVRNNADKLYDRVNNKIKKIRNYYADTNASLTKIVARSICSEGSEKEKENLESSSESEEESEEENNNEESKHEEEVKEPKEEEEEEIEEEI